MRIGCVYFPKFFIQVELKKKPALSKKAVAIYLPSEKIVDVSQEAQKHGIWKNMDLREAQSICPRCIFMPLDEKEVEFYSRFILEILFSITPVIERDEHFFFLDITHLDEQETENIKDLIKNKTGFEAKIGIASNKFVSKIASLFAEDILIVISGKEAEFLKDLPIDYLPMSGDWIEKLKLLGLNKIDDIQKLPLSFFTTYFGKEGKNIISLSKGIDEQKILRTKEEVKERIDLTFYPPTESIEEVLSQIDRALSVFDGKKVYPSRFKLIFSFIHNKTIEKELFIREEKASKYSLLLRIKTFIENRKEGKPLSGITLIFSDYEMKRGTQLGLFPVRKENLLSTIIFLRKKYGRGVICANNNETLPNKIWRRW
ncbi:MAG: hypothetical protein N2513_08310 [Deltaproteobacteria bacterium]|nr:hypothetical protein [Deltaproteobacteria bacterium]